MHWKPQGRLLNLVEYKLGTHPLEPDSLVMTTEHSAAGLKLTYPHVTTRTDASLTPVTVSDLSTIPWVTTGVTVESDLGANGNATFQSGAVSAGSAQAFLRLEAQRF